MMALCVWVIKDNLLNIYSQRFMELWTNSKAVFGVPSAPMHLVKLENVFSKEHPLLPIIINEAFFSMKSAPKIPFLSPCPVFPSHTAHCLNKQLESLFWTCPTRAHLRSFASRFTGDIYKHLKRSFFLERLKVSERTNETLSLFLSFSRWHSCQ